MFFFPHRKKHKKHKHKKGSENGDLKTEDKKNNKKTKENLSVILVSGSSKREVKGATTILTNGNKINNIESSESDHDKKKKEVDSDGVDVSVIEDEMNLDELMRQKVN